jgi:hypothetical protein
VKKIFFLILLTLMALPRFLTAQNVLPGYNGFWDRNKEITVLDILDYYPDRLPYLRNEVYARYGRSFVTKAYQDYFNRQSWYRIRDDYTDDWLSGADRYNAELLRAIEQAPSAADSLSRVQRNVEYTSVSSQRRLIFGSSEAMEADKDDSFEIYGRSVYGSGSVKPYVIIGDWVLLYDYTSSPLSTKTTTVNAYRLNHGARTVTASASGQVTKAVLDPLIRAQGNFR